MPTGAKELSLPLGLLNGVQMDMKGYAWDNDADNAGFLAAYFRIPVIPTDKAGYDQFFKTAVAGFVKSGAGEVKSEKEIQFGNFEGREYGMEMPSPAGATAPGVMRVYVVQDRFFMLVIVGPGFTPDSTETKAFFDSFKLAKK